MVKVEVETETEEQVREAVAAGADIIMFDNRTPDEIREFSKIVPSAIVTEASGGITKIYRNTEKQGRLYFTWSVNTFSEST